MTFAKNVKTHRRHFIINCQEMTISSDQETTGTTESNLNIHAYQYDDHDDGWPWEMKGLALGEEGKRV